MSDEEVSSPYNYAKLREITEPRLERPFHNEVIFDYDVGRVEGQQRPCETDRNDVRPESGHRYAERYVEDSELWAKAPDQ